MTQLSLSLRCNIADLQSPFLAAIMARCALTLAEVAALQATRGGRPAGQRVLAKDAHHSAGQGALSGPLDRVIAEFNANYMVVNEAGKALIYATAHDPILRRRFYNRMGAGDLRFLYQNQRIEVGVTQGRQPHPGPRGVTAKPCQMFRVLGGLGAPLGSKVMPPMNCLRFSWLTHTSASISSAELPALSQIRHGGHDRPARQSAVIRALRREISKGTTLDRMILIDPPGPFAPRSERLAFLREYENDPRDLPEIREAIRSVRESLEQDDTAGP